VHRVFVRKQLVSMLQDRDDCRPKQTAYLIVSLTYLTAFAQFEKYHGSMVKALDYKLRSHRI